MILNNNNKETQTPHLINQKSAVSIAKTILLHLPHL